MLSRTLVTEHLLVLFFCCLMFIFIVGSFAQFIMISFLYTYLLGCVEPQLWHVASSLWHADSVVEARGLWTARAQQLPCMGFVASRHVGS